MKKTLTEAVAVGNATARAISFRNRDPRAPLYQNSQWKTGFIGGDYRWLDGDGHVRPQPRRAHGLLLHRDRQHARDGR